MMILTMVVIMFFMMTILMTVVICIDPPLYPHLFTKHKQNKTTWATYITHGGMV